MTCRQRGRERERGVVMGHKLEPGRWAEQPSISARLLSSGPRCDDRGGGGGGGRVPAVPPLGSRMLIKATGKVTPGHHESRLHQGGESEVGRMGGAGAHMEWRRSVISQSL